MKELPKKYNHIEAEKKWQKYWEEHKVFAWDEDDDSPRENSFVIDTPPPTVSGVLHMGHIFSYTQADYIARYQRMSGKNVFYPMGFDDNGLPTERLVEKVKKIRAHQMSREEFIGQCEGVAEEARKEFRRLFESVALSVDWAQEYHTISEESRRISQLSFLDLYHKQRAYRKLQPMLWDPVDQTAIAQAEIEDKELDSFENYLTFGLDDGSGERVGEFQIMTTRPELLPACVAVMCDPNEYHKYKGMKAIRPISGMRIPIIPDDKVDVNKGTGMVMCCTFGDETDIYWYETYKDEYDLPLRVVLNRYGKFDADLLDKALGNNPNKQKVIDLVAGLTVKKAREEVFIKALEDDNSLARREPIKHAVKCAERSGAALEILPTQQWFIKVLDQKEELKARAAECNWYPEYMRVRIDQWIDGLNWDWCISRQRYFGVPFPVWYVEQKLEARNQKPEIIVARVEDLPVNPLSDLPHGYKLKERLEDGRVAAVNEAGEEVIIAPEADVMDTWATSSVSPQLSSKGINRYTSPACGGGKKSEQLACQISGGGTKMSDEQGNPFILNESRHSKLFPADLRPQAHEIIRTWAFYTIVKAHLHEDKIPWKNLMISGWCLASDKTKMSKSKGNVVTPVDLIEEKGADVVRYWSSTSKLGTDTAFSEDVLKIGKKLVTKLWNAAKFAAIHLDKVDGEPLSAAEDIKNNVITETLDKWIITRLHRAISKATKEFEQFEYSDARSAVEDFFWNDFCDNYLEMVKKRVYGESESENAAQLQKSAAHTIYHCLDAVLRLFAPIVPHVTEELYSHIFDNRHAAITSIHSRGQWPDATDFPVDEMAEKAGIASRAVLDVVRRIKAEQNVSIKWPLENLVISGKENEDKNIIESCFPDLANVTNAKNVEWADSTPDNAELTEDGAFYVSVTLATEADA